MPSTAARVIYPKPADPLIPADQRRLFSPSYSERGWEPTNALRRVVAKAVVLKNVVDQTSGSRRVCDV